ncbi:MAG TPA: N-acetylmuramoyl-L-alanine amidase [Gammaproteobacteria bacterium]|nr:N-acetylmuramoyl-L-alanine amidase [Gammaproteobacteria bacterium]
MYPHLRRQLCFVIAACLLLDTRLALAAAKAEILDFRLARTGGSTRLVFDLNAPVEHSVFTLSKPERVVIDIQNVGLGIELPARPDGIPPIEGIRNAPRDKDGLRVVLDLSEPVRPKSFLLPPEDAAGYRLVIDLVGNGDDNNDAIQSPPMVAKRLPEVGPLRDLVIAVDAGHGGKDPGAIGKRGTREKQVVLAIARELARQINRERGMKAVLIRDGDYYIGLRERITKARLQKADLFISIHADAHKNTEARGSSIYALSLRGASSEAAALLADRENASELIGGVSLDDKDDLVASVLIDLSQTATIQSSLDVGDEILKDLKRHGKLHRESVQQAGFMVLKSPAIPSVLVETAFISNPEEERKLSNRQYQDKLAQTILSGIKRYFQRKAPPGTLLAQDNQPVEKDLTAASW